jgi:uncharacterized alpha/beta hydrolase family protein
MNNIMFGKHVTASDLAYMVKKNLWTSATVYDQYDDEDPALSDCNFYVYTLEGGTYYVFKCLFNNNGAESTSKPTFADTSASDTFYETEDGYQWKYMYKIPSAIFDKYNTDEYIPYVEDANVTSNSVSGSIDVVLIESAGSGYTNYFADTFDAASVINSDTPYCILANTASKTPGLYEGCLLYITGGTGAGQYRTITGHSANASSTYVYLDDSFTTVPDNTSTYSIDPKVEFVMNTDDTQPTSAAVAARAIVNATTNSISSIDILNRGADARHAEAYVFASPQSAVTNTAVLRVVTSPRGGHGSNVRSELYCSRLCISTKFANTESNTIPTSNPYRTAGILKNPLFANVHLITSNQVGTFTSGEVVSQNTGATGIVTATAANTLILTNVSGFFVSSANATGATSNAVAYVDSYLNNGVVKTFSTFDQRFKLEGSYLIGQFATDDTVYQTDIDLAEENSDFTANAVFLANNSSGNTVYLTQKRGPIYASNTIHNIGNTTFFHINTITVPDLVLNAGDVIYLENFDARTRSNTTTETIKLLLEY